MKAILKRTLLALLVILCLAYLVDYAQLRYRVWKNGQPYGTVTVQIVYVISEKSTPGTNKVEYSPAGAQDETCVNALFPHFGFKPCWYLSRHTERRITI